MKLRLSISHKFQVHFCQDVCNVPVQQQVLCFLLCVCLHVSQKTWQHDSCNQHHTFSHLRKLIQHLFKQKRENIVTKCTPNSNFVLLKFVETEGLVLWVLTSNRR